MAKHKEKPIPADLMALTLDELRAEADSHDDGKIRERREHLVAERDAAQAELKRLSDRRHDLNRAMIAKMKTQ